MVQFITILSGALLAGMAIAQEPNPSFNTSVVSQVAGEVDASTSSAWCNSQYRACNVLCGKASDNKCEAKTLIYTCTCTANNSAPAFQYYNPTMITNICNRYLGDCLKANAGRADQQDSCKTTIVCGNSSIDAYANSSAASSTSSASSSVASSTTGSTSSPSPTKNAAALLESCSNYGTGIFGAILLGAFGLYL